MVHDSGNDFRPDFWGHRIARRIRRSDSLSHHANPFGSDVVDFYAAPISAGRHPLCFDEAKSLVGKVVQHLARSESAAHVAPQERTDKDCFDFAEEPVRF